MKKTANNTGFALFVALIAVTLLAIVGVVGYVILTKHAPLSNLPNAYVAPAPTAVQEAVATVTPEAVSTPAPTISTSTDMQVIGKELDDTKVDSVDPDMNALKSSASSL